MMLLAVFTLGLATVERSTSPWILSALLCGRGIAIGLTTQPLVFSLLGRLPQAQQADANTMFTTTQRLAGSVGVALLTSYYAVQVRATHSAVIALHHTAVLLSVIAGLGIPAGLWLVRRSRRLT